MSSGYSTETAKTGRSRLESLLPAISNEEVQEGWIETFPDLQSVRIRAARNQPGAFRSIILDALGRHHVEQVRINTRYADIGTFAVQGYAPKNIAQLHVSDARYASINPVDKNSQSVRLTAARFAVGASEDADGYHYECGLQFAFLEEAKDAPLRMGITDYAIAPRGPFNITGQYLADHSLPELGSPAMEERAMQVLDHCIAEAQASQQ